MLIKYYDPAHSKTLNHTPLHMEQMPGSVAQKYKNIPFYTTSLDVFDNIPPDTIADMLQQQEAIAIQEADLLLKHSFLTKSTHEKTIKQYKTFFFYNEYSYRKTDVIEYVSNQNLKDTVYINEPEQYQSYAMNVPEDEEVEYVAPEDDYDEPQKQKSPQRNQPSFQVEDEETYDETQPPFANGQNIVTVSREALRIITGYSYNAIREWDKTRTPVYVKWQHDLLEDEHEIIVVDGSRQMGKSFTIAQKLIEESHIPNNDSLVGAFLEKTTNVIRNYVLKLTRRFPEGHFEHFKKEGYIINKKTLTKIYFRTLSDGGDNVLGLTLKRAIIDEAQFVPESTFEDAINPTLSTTGGQLIMIGTPAKKKTGYMYKTIMDIKRGILSKEEASYYRISIDQNPFIHPKKRRFVEKHKNEAAYQRQYYNAWGDIGDSLFSVQQEPEFPNIGIAKGTNNFVVMGIDPARINDRSANSILYVHYNPETKQEQITIIISGFVPDSHKKKWELQAAYYNDLIKKWNGGGEQSPNWYNVIDVTGVGDGVVSIFQGAGIKIAGKIRYTSGNIDSNDGMDFKTSKSILINNFIDMCQEGIIKVYHATNKDLLEEMTYIEEGESRFGQTTMKSDFFDDITNATMIAAYFIKARRLLGRAKRVEASPYVSSGNSHIDSIENRGNGGQAEPNAYW